MFQPSIIASAVLLAAMLAPNAAHAGWTQLPLWNAELQQNVSSARACKTRVDSIYGPLWRINFQVFRKNGNAHSITAMSIRSGVGTVNNQQTNDKWLHGVVAGTGNNVYASLLHDDVFWFAVNWSQPINGFQTVFFTRGSRPGAIATC